jgi:hypothetical protein
MGVYVDLAKLKASLKEQSSDRDDLLNDVIAAAEAGVDDHCGRTFTVAPTAAPRVLSPYGRVAVDAAGEHLLVPDIGSLAGLVVETGTTVAGWTPLTGVEAEPLDALDRGRAVTSLLRPGGPSWPTGATRIRVTARWGWPAVPAAVRHAATLQAHRLWKRRDSPEGVLGSAEWGAVRVARVDPDVEALLAPFRRPGIA